MSEDIRLIHGDCLDVMADIPAGSVDLILADLPYGTTACAWDAVIPFELLWCHYRRVLKSCGAVVLTATQPFTTDLIQSNRGWFKYCWVWDKKKPANFQVAKYRPLAVHEDVVVFGPGRVTYNPQKTPRPVAKKLVHTKGSDAAPIKYMDGRERIYTDYHPKSIIEFSNADQRGKINSTQKPVELMEYLVRTYSNKGDTILDNCMGSGTTIVACINTGRKGIGIEKDRDSFIGAEERIAEIRRSPTLLSFIADDTPGTPEPEPIHVPTLFDFVGDTP